MGENWGLKRDSTTSRNTLLYKRTLTEGGREGDRKHSVQWTNKEHIPKIHTLQEAEESVQQSSHIKVSMKSAEQEKLKKVVVQWNEVKTESDEQRCELRMKTIILQK